MADTSNTSGGVGFFGAMSIALMVLKILHKVDLPWVLIFAPVIASAIISVIVLSVLGLFVKALKK